MDFRKEGSGREDFGAFKGCFIFRVEGSLTMKNKGMFEKRVVLHTLTFNDEFLERTHW